MNQLAEVHKGQSNLNIKGWGYTIAGVVISLAGFALFARENGILAFVFLIAGTYIFRKGRRYSSGAAGEARSRSYLKKLPDSYRVYTNVRVHEKMEADRLRICDVGNRWPAADRYNYAHSLSAGFGKAFVYKLPEHRGRCWL